MGIKSTIKPPHLNGMAADVVQILFALNSQWRVGMGGRTGLDYSAIPIAESKTGIELNQAGFSILQQLEGMILEDDNKESKDG